MQDPCNPLRRLTNRTTAHREDLITATGKAYYRPYAPYLGIGWASGGDKRDGLFYSIDVGLMYLGRARVEYSFGGPLADAVRTYYGPELDAAIADEQRASAEKLNRYRYYPVVSVGISYRF